MGRTDCTLDKPEILMEILLIAFVVSLWVFYLIDKKPPKGGGWDGEYSGGIMD